MSRFARLNAPMEVKLTLPTRERRSPERGARATRGAALAGSALLAAASAACSAPTPLLVAVDASPADVGPPDAPALSDAGPRDAGPAPDARVSCDFDWDEDGVIDRACGGTDCDDGDPEVRPGAAELCGNERDEDCDGNLCTSSPCVEAALDLAVPGTTPVATVAGGVGQLGLAGCALDLDELAPRAERYVRLTLTEPSSVRIELGVAAPGPGPRATAVAALVSDCGALPPVRGCASVAAGAATPLAIARLEAGTHWLAIASSTPREVSVTVTREAPRPPPGDVCATAPELSGPTSTILLDAFVTSDDLATGCMPEGSRDVAYDFTLTEPADVRIRPLVTTGFPTGVNRYGVAIREDCELASTERWCRAIGGDTSVGVEGETVRNLPAGRYTLILESATAVGVELEVSLRPPTAPGPGETCELAIPLVSGVLVADSFEGRDDNLTDTCQRGAPDAFYRFVLDGVSDVDVFVEHPFEEFIGLELREGCEAGLASIAGLGRAEACGYGFNRYRALPPGTYTLIASGSRALPYRIGMRAVPARPQIAVSGNETCDTAYTVPATGGSFSGAARTTDHRWDRVFCGPFGPDAVFRLELDRPQRVRLVPAGYVVVDLLEERCATETLALCDDDGWTGVLDAGTWFVLARPFGGEDDYVLDIDVEDP
ncbi:MAG: MopE-related protein [Deltaproteobacteria bacterium]